jgi:replication-associated recombination protein RarA
VFVLQPLTQQAIEQILRRALTDREHGLGRWRWTCPTKSWRPWRASRTEMRARR